MADIWLFDGWNVLHGLSQRAGVLFKSLTPDGLLSILSDFAAQQGCKILVLLDGHGPGGDHRLSWKTSDRVTILYSQDQTADAVLERYLYDHRSQAQFSVVSDDGAIGRLAHGMGARVITTERFASMLNELRNERANKAHENKIHEHGFNRPFGKALEKWKIE